MVPHGVDPRAAEQPRHQGAVAVGSASGPAHPCGPQERVAERLPLPASWRGCVCAWAQLQPGSAGPQGGGGRERPKHPTVMRLPRLGGFSLREAFAAAAPCQGRERIKRLRGSQPFEIPHMRKAVHALTDFRAAPDPDASPSHPPLPGSSSPLRLAQVSACRGPPWHLAALRVPSRGHRCRQSRCQPRPHP